MYIRTGLSCGSTGFHINSLEVLVILQPVIQGLALFTLQGTSGRKKIHGMNKRNILLFNDWEV